MSSDDLDRPDRDRPARLSDEDRVVDALAAFADHVHPGDGGWDRIADRIEATPTPRLGRAVREPGARARRARVLVAAGFVAFLVVAAAVVVHARSADDDVQVATTPSPAVRSAIVALTLDSRLVELDDAGVEQREIYRSPDDGTHLIGQLAVSAADRTTYVERIRPGRCDGDTGVVRYGEIVAVPFAGGEPTVVVPVGEMPTLSPDGRALAFLAPTDDRTCSTPPIQRTVAVLDLTTGDRATLLREPAIVSAEVPVVADPSWLGGEGWLPWVADLTWGSDGALYVLASASAPDQSGTAPRVTVERLTFGGQVGYPAERVGYRYDPGPVPGELPDDHAVFFPTQFVAVPASTGGGADRFLLAGSQTVSVRGILQILGVALTETGVTDGATDVSIDPSIYGMGFIDTHQLDRDPRTGRLLLAGSDLARPDAKPPAFLTGDTSTLFYTDEVPATSVLLIRDDTGVHQVADGILSAVWITTTDTPQEPWREPEPEAAQQPEPDPSSTEPGTLVPVDADPSVPTSLLATDSADVAAGRPEDAAEIAESFRAFFEHGDRSVLEGSGVLEPAIQDGAKTVPGGGVGLTLTLDGIGFTGPDEAEVRFRLDQGGNQFTAPAIGSAVRIDGQWKVSAATLCMLLSRASIPCPVTAP